MGAAGEIRWRGSVGGMLLINLPRGAAWSGSIGPSDDALRFIIYGHGPEMNNPPLGRAAACAGEGVNFLAGDWAEDLPAPR